MKSDGGGEWRNYRFGDEVRVEDAIAESFEGMGGLRSGVGLWGEVSKIGFFYLENAKYFCFFNF